jgi:hypothetical protein
MPRLELHFNAFDGKSRGSLTIFDKEPPAGAELARYVQNAIVTALQREGRREPRRPPRERRATAATGT